MKKVYMIHGWGGGSEENWFPWLKKELQNRGAKVFVFDMPDSENPKIEAWVSYLEKNIKNVDEETFFVGHSVGCQTIMRFLEKLPKHKKVGGCFFVAPWFNLINLEHEEMEIAHPWISSNINFLRILDHCDNFLALFSKDDPYVPISDESLFKERIYAKTIIEKNAGHFEKDVEPNILKELLKFLKLK